MKALEAFLEFIYTPRKVLLACGAVAVALLFLDGTLYRIWDLQREQKNLQDRISVAHERSQELAFQVSQAQSPEFIERQARDLFDFVEPNDLVFMFPDDVSDSSNTK